MHTTASQRRPTVRDRASASAFADAVILVVSADAAIAAAAEASLGDHGCRLLTVASVEAVAAALGDSAADVVLIDATLLKAATEATMVELRQACPGAAVIVVCDSDDLELMAASLELGAVDFLLRPIEALVHRTIASVGQALRAVRLGRDNRQLHQKLAGAQSTSGFVGCSPAHRRLLSAVARAADGEATILVEGPPGSGKTTVAEMIHAGGRRGDQPMVARCGDGLAGAGLEQALQESRHGTLLLEDIDRLPAEAQSRLVRFLKERKERSATEPRLIATTANRLPELVARGAFREDLYYRLNVLPIVVPGLADRRDDIPLLAVHFLQEVAGSLGTPATGFTPAAMAALETTAWPGNADQLRGVVTRAFAVAGTGPIDASHLSGAAPGVSRGAVDPKRARPADPDDEGDVAEAEIIPFKDEEKRILSRALRATKGNVRRAAQLLRIGRATLYRKIQSYRLRLH